MELTQLNPDGWRTKLDKRTRNRMKITFKLNQDETAAYERFKTEAKPDGVAEDDFVRSIFFMGLASLEQRLVASIQEALHKQAQEQGASVPDTVDPQEVLDSIVDSEASE